MTAGEAWAEVGTPLSTCPITLTRSGSYYLSSNIYTPTGTCITVRANNVTIDLKGFVVGRGSRVGFKEPDTEPGHGIYMSNRSNVEIRNGSIVGFGLGGIYEDGENARNHRIIDVRVIGTGASSTEGWSGYDYIRAGITLVGSHHLVKDSTIARTGEGGGIVVAGSARIIGNTISGNERLGISAGAFSTITNNIVDNNWWGGI